MITATLPTEFQRDLIMNLMTLRRVDEEQGELLFWLHSFGQEKNLSDSTLANMMRVSSGAISQFLSGKYAAEDWSGRTDRIKALKEVEDEAVKNLDLEFVMTQTAKTIFSVCAPSRPAPPT